jgi:hypothetical protein
MLRKIRIALSVTFVALAAVTAVDSASALGFGYGQIGGYERGGYEYSQEMHDGGGYISSFGP